MRRTTVALGLLLALGAAACGEPDAPGAHDPVPPASADVARAESAQASDPGKTGSEKAEAQHHHEGRPLPAFDGVLLDGQRRSISDYIGRRLVLFFFNPDVDDSAPVADALARIATERQRNNFEVVGVAMGSTGDKAREFARKHGLTFPIFDDSSARIAGRLGLRSRVAVIGVDAEGYLLFGMGAFPTDVPDAAKVVEDQLGEALRLPKRPAANAGALDRRPVAPDFDAPRIDGGGERLRLADYAGKPVVLIFFLHTCPHCHAALEFFKDALAKIPEASRPTLLGISVQDRPSAVLAMLHDSGLDYFPVATDPDSSVRNSYGVFGGVPDILFIAPDGHIDERIRGWEESRDPSLSRMYLARIAGQPIPMILNPKGYTGSDVCGICHEREFQTWQYTNHAAAFDTLVAHGSQNDPECVSCHVVGYGKPGGYDLAQAPAHLENVGCEDCHGRGGPHLSPDFVSDGHYEKVCRTCHDAKHSLGFDYATFSPKISHAAIAALTPAQREAMVQGRGEPRDLLPRNAKIVGSDACRSCHPAEYATWEKSGHAHAVETLARKGKASDADCLACHTTAYDRPGGFPAGGSAAAHPDLARVGCESCHGPGGDHVAEGSRKIGTIVSLGDKCDSCVILQICGGCHDDANDPGFRFQVEARIEAQRHGTIEAGTGRPLDGNEASKPSGRPEAALESAFHVLDRQG